MSIHSCVVFVLMQRYTFFNYILARTVFFFTLLAKDNLIFRQKCVMKSVLANHIVFFQAFLNMGEKTASIFSAMLPSPDLQESLPCFRP